MRRNPQYCQRFPGRKAVLDALTESGGSWTPHQMFDWARRNGGTADTYAALAWHVRKGKLTYSPTPRPGVWSVPS